MKPGLGHCPLTSRGRARNTKHVGRLLEAESREVPQLDEAFLIRIELGEAGECLVEGDDVDVSLVGGREQCLFEGKVFGGPAAFFTAMRSRMIDQYPTHRLSRDREEMSAIPPLDMPLVDKFEVGLMYECCGLQRVVGPLSTQICSGLPVQFGINQRQKVVNRSWLAGAPITQHLSDVRIAGAWLVH